jgi:hypothetical protein
MEAFEEYKKRAEVKTIGYLNNSAAFNAGREVGWRAAFVNVQQWLMGRRCTGEDVLDYINKELLSNQADNSSD